MINLSDTINDMVVKGKGILAADESSKTIAKRFQTINLESTEEHRRTYRTLLSTTNHLAQYVSGVILFEETLGQKVDSGAFIPEFLAKNNIVPGIKVDKGLIDLPQFPGEKITQGLDGLAERLAQYKEQGARFAKWRSVFYIANNTPSRGAIMANAQVLARYAAICQSQGIVPIVEPELLMEGDHTLEKCAEVTEVILRYVFRALHQYRVVLEHIVLKPNMVLPGKDCTDQSHPEAIGAETIKVLRRAVPAAVPSINFLSGGQSSEEATANLNAINALGPQPWHLSFSYGRALQEHCLKTWQGNDGNVKVAQDALFKRAKLNGAATLGNYEVSMEAL